MASVSGMGSESSSSSSSLLQTDQSPAEAAERHHPGRRRDASDASSSSTTTTEWYTKYPVYPDYCATPDQMALRSIPPLPETSKAGDSRLLHVTALVRHGARTPWNIPSYNSTCWPGYKPIWNCDLTTWIGTPPRNEQEHGGMFWMNKEYTALQDPERNLTNSWGGTCQHGQLLLQGYDQELQNGNFLRNAYVYHGDKDYSHDRRLRLLDSSTLFRNGDNALASSIYYRSDDDQRTLMSGQIVLRGMFQDELDGLHKNLKSSHRHPILPLHVADRERDVLGANLDICPRLKEIQDRYHKSQEYQAFLQSPQVQLVQDFKKQVLEGGTATVDCLMTTMCTDRDLPDAVNDYQGEDLGQDNFYFSSETTVPSSSPGSGDGSGDETKDYGDHIFRRLAQHDAMPYNMLATANDGEFSKVAMGPLWDEIMYHIKAATRGVTEGDPTPAKFALFSGHDTTLLPLLASLGAWKISDWWPSYASMMILELHEVNFGGNTDTSVYPTNHAFRLLYNGQVWTPRIDGCPAAPEQFCDLDILIDLTTPMMERDCTLQHPTPATFNDHVKEAQEILKTSGGQWAVGAVAIASFVLGMLFTVTFVSCCCSSSSRSSLKRRRQLVPGYDDEDGIVMGERPVTSYRDNAETLTMYHDEVDVPEDEEDDHDQHDANDNGTFA